MTAKTSVNSPVGNLVTLNDTDKRSGSHGMRSWTHQEIVKRWKQGNFLTTQTEVSDTFSVNNIAQDIASSGFSQYSATNLLEHWIEMVLLHLYLSAFGELSKRDRYVEVLYTQLNKDFLPGKATPLALASQSRMPIEQVSNFLLLFERWVEQRDGCYIDKLGCLVCQINRPSLVVSWDKFIAQAGYLQDWDKSLEAVVLSKETDRQLRLRVYPSDRKENPTDVSYKIFGSEAEDLQPGYRVRYWKDLNGRPFICAAVPLSPFIARRKGEWSRIDEDTYTSDSMSVG